MAPSEAGDEEIGGFRQTRAGIPFSPWFANVGVPLHAPADFPLHRRVQEVILEQERWLAEQEDASAPPRPSDRDELPVSAAEDFIPVETTSAPPFIPIPMSKSESYPPMPFDDTLSKGQFHRKKQKKKIRAKQRMFGQDPDMNRPVKGIALHEPSQSLLSGAGLNRSDSALPGLSSEGPAGERPRGPIISDLHLDMNELPVASTAFTGVLYDVSAEDLACTELEDFAARDFQYIQWDGLTTLVILDSTGTYVLCTFGPPPNDSSYREGVNKDLQEAFADAHAQYRFPEEPNRRGEDVKGVTVGISMGGGQPKPGNIAYTSRTNAKVAEDLRTNHSALRVANHANALFQIFQPELYKVYDRTLTGLCERDPTLRRNFHNNVFACATFNVGPNTATCKHLDFLNLAYGMCAVTALGNYDHTRGGHIVLWELRMVIEFPPTCTSFIPSAVISHSNVAIRPGETRHSFTQYSAGGLFRWKAARYQTLKNLRKGGGELPGTGHERWANGIEMWSKWEDVQRRLEAYRSSSDKAA